MKFGQLGTLSLSLSLYLSLSLSLCVYIFTRPYLHCCVAFSCFVSPVVVEKLVSTGLYLKYLYLCIIILQWSEGAKSIAGSGPAAGRHRSVRYDSKSFGDAARPRLRGSGCCAIVSKSSDDIY